MLQALLMFLLMPFAAQAQTAAPSNDWHACRTDADCELVEGPCKPTGVNRAYKSIAENYYKNLPKKACESQFWGKPNAVRCRLEACEAVIN